MDIRKAIESFQRTGFTVTYFETGSEAVDYLLSEIRGKTVGFGGSMTVKALGLDEKLGENNTVYSRNIDNSPETTLKANNTQVYISSVNGISETGEIINIDGSGNRVAALMYNHEKVYYLVGTNKLSPDFDSAMFRARNVASPLNARRLNKKTPCAMGEELKCYNCNSPDRICRGFTVITHPMFSVGETEIVFINEPLGY